MASSVVIVGHFDKYTRGTVLVGSEMKDFLSRNPPQELYVKINTDVSASSAPTQAGEE